jgi:hypothetical protein
MDRSTSRPPSPQAPILMIGGAAVAVVGCLLPWFAVHADFSALGGEGARVSTASGLDTSDGKIFLLVAVGIAAMGVVVLLSRVRSARLASSVVAVLGSLFLGGVAIYDAATPQAQAIEEVSNELGSGTGAAAVRRLVEGLFDRGFIEIDVQAGLWIVIVGATVALIGGLLAAATSGSAPAAAGAAAATRPGGSVPPEPTVAGPTPAPQPTPPPQPTAPSESTSGPIGEDADRPPGS